MGVVCSVISVAVLDKLDGFRLFLKERPRLPSTSSIKFAIYFIFHQNWRGNGKTLSAGCLLQSGKKFISELDFYRLIVTTNFLQGFETKKINSRPNFCYENFLKYLLERCVSEKLNKCDFKNIKNSLPRWWVKNFFFSFWNSLTECVRWRSKIFSLIQRRKTFISRLTRNETWKWRKNVTG